MEKAERIEEALDALKLAEQIFEYSYSVIDKRTCKVKRNVALLYLKSNRYDEALDVLKEVEELERTLYGEASTQLAKTYKVIGTLYIINSSPQEAREYLLRALGIFEAKGLIKLLKEVKSKLKMLNSSVKMAAEMAAQEAVDGGSGDDSGREGSPSGDRKQGSAGRSGNKRKFAMPNGVALAAAKTAEAALGRKMSLTFARDTLEKSIQMVSEEIGLPIEILGKDLELDGITKNQSFGLEERNQTADAVLRAILARSNPDGKLVYVIRSRDGVESIEITTRAAAAKRKDPLPAVFADQPATQAMKTDDKKKPATRKDAE